MKKIIATVLAMVMALALCTVAFAANTTTTTVESKGWTMKDMDNVAITIVGDKFTKTVKGNDVIDNVTYYFADVYEIDDTTYYACDDTIATNKLFKGSEIVYLTTVNVNGVKGISKVVDKTIDAVKEPACGEYQKDTDADEHTVLVIDNVAYWSCGTNFAMLNGKAISYAGKADAVPHTFTDDVTTDTKGNYVAVTCDVCEKSFKLVEAVPANYTGTVAQFNNNEYFVLLDSTYVDGTTTTTTTSPKTFDAGIAMYVGMALTSVAGSAVVIGKKKEF